MGDVYNQSGVCPRVRGPTSASHIMPQSVLHKPYSDDSFQRGGSGTTRFTGGGSGEQSRKPGLLQPLLSRPKALREVERDTRSISSKLESKEVLVQNGDTRQHQDSVSGQILGNISRSAPCLLSCPSGSEIQEISEIYDKWEGSPVQGTPNGSSEFSMGLHENNKTSVEICSSSWDPSNTVPGRLAPSSSGTASSTGTHESDSGVDKESGILDKSREVRIESISSHRLHRHETGSAKSDGSSNGQSLRTTQETVRQSTKRSRSVSKALGEVGVNVQIHGKSDDHGGSKSKTTTVVSETEVASEVSVQVVSDRDDVPNSASCQMVVSEGGGGQTSSSNETSSSAIDLHRRFDGGLGRPPPVKRSKSGVVRTLVSGSKATAHQHPRTQSSGASSRSSSKMGKRKIPDGGIGQYNCNFLSEQTGRNTFKELEYRIPRITRVGQGTGDTHKGSAHPGKTKRNSGHVISQGSDPSDRMVITPVSVQDVVSQVGHSEPRLVCDKPQREVASLCVTSSGPSSSCDRLSKHKLGGNARICLSSDGPTPTGVTQNSEGELQNIADSSILAHPEVVPRPDGNGEGRPSATASSSLPSKPALDRAGTHGPRPSQPSRVDLIRSKLSEKYHTTVADVMADPHRKSSSNTYDSRWDGFVEWCIVKNLIPTQGTEAQVAEFLVYLSKEKGRVLNTLRGYLTAISRVIVLYTGEKLSSSKELGDLLTSLSKDEVPSYTKVPEWDLSVVLKALKKAPFEPLDSCNLSYLTYKTAFLITLASGGRRSEVHALSTIGLTHGPKYEWVVIYPSVRFLRKNQTVSQGAAGINPIRLEALPADSEGKVDLCPVRALLLYLDRIAPQRKGRTSVFLPIPETVERPLHVHTMSSWLKKCIHIAYASSGHVEGKATGHDIRKLAVSWAFQSQVSTENLLRVCRWKSHNAFTKFYLKECIGIRDGMLTVGPIFAAGHLV